MKLLFIVLISSLYNSALVYPFGETECKKKSPLEKRCCIKNGEEQKRLTAKILDTLTKSMTWIQERQLLSRKRWRNPQSLVWLSKSFLVRGCIHDNRLCLNEIKDEITKAALKDLLKLPGGRLAVVLLSLAKPCSSTLNKNLEKSVLVRELLGKMKRFPEKGFNNFYQYSLAMIALFLNGEDIQEEFGNQLLRGVFIGRKRNSIDKYGITKDPSNAPISRTEAMGLLALKAMTQQKFLGHWTRKHALREQVKVKKKIERMLTNSMMYSTKDFVNFIHFLQILNINKEQYCQKVLTELINRQSKDGSFDHHLLTTSLAIYALEGKSILDFKHKQCPLKNVMADEEKIGKHANTKIDID